MPESPLTKEVTVGWAYVETEHEIRRERPAEGLALEGQTPESESDGSPPVGEIEAWDGECSVSRSPSSGARQPGARVSAPWSRAAAERGPARPPDTAARKRPPNARLAQRSRA